MQRFFVRVFGSDGPGKRPLPVTFEAAFTALSELPRLFIEPDGSFVWRSPSGEATWQVDGNLVDGGETLYYCELKGLCPAEAMAQVLACLSDGKVDLAFEGVEEGILLDRRRFLNA